MTNEEAIEQLKHMKVFIGYDAESPMVKEMQSALELAIKALEQEPCEDCISRAQALHACCDEWNKDYKAIMKSIRQLPSVTPQPRWIPVSERLPEANGRYVVTRGLNACGALWNRVYIVNYSDLMGLKSEKIWWSGNVGKSDFERIDDVIAWMPLPEPYKAESEE